MPIGDSYAQISELKPRLNITDTDDDARLTEALDAASRDVERFTRRQFNMTSSATSRVYEPLHDRLVLVDDFHTTSSLEVAVDTAEDGTYGTVLSSSKYALEPRNGVVEGVPGWPFWRIRAYDLDAFPVAQGRATVQVTAEWGWAEVPAPIKEATLVQAAELFKLADAPFGVAGFGEFGAVRVRPNPKVTQLLAPYQLYTVGVA